MVQVAKGPEAVFVVAVVLDAVYQLIIQRGVFLLELLVVAIVLAIVPYVLVRGPVSRPAAALRQRTDRAATCAYPNTPHPRAKRRPACLGFARKPNPVINALSNN